MFKYSIAVAVALAIAPSASFARSRDTLPVFSGVYQVSGHWMCATGEQAQLSGTFTFDGSKFTMSIWGFATTLVHSTQTNPYTVTADTFSEGKITYQMTTHLDHRGIVRTATLINSESDPPNTTCSNQWILFR